jgi:Recombination endonuclease VII
MPSLSKLYTRREIDELRRRLIREHGDHCAVCQKPSSAFKKRLSVDHNHKTDKVRGLLCYRCNKFLVGRQTIESARKLLNYLEKYDIPDKIGE